jgi:hypothetical protein
MRLSPTRLPMVAALALAGCSLALHAAETADSISEKAKAIVGLREIASVARVTLAEEDAVPFLRQQLTGAQAWRVTFQATDLTSPSAGLGEKDAYARSITALLLDETGQLVSLKIVSPHEKDLPVPAPPVEKVEAQLRSQKEIYVALPIGLPKVSAMQAVDGVRTSGLGTPYLAKEIDVQYVTISNMDRLPTAAWVVSCRGIPPMPAKGRGATEPPVWQRDRLRTIVDPATGKSQYATNTPVPEKREVKEGE